MTEQESSVTEEIRQGEIRGVDKVLITSFTIALFTMTLITLSFAG